MARPSFVDGENSRLKSGFYPRDRYSNDPGDESASVAPKL
jgi:hypothetical protein